MKNAHEHPFLTGDFCPAWSSLTPEHVEKDINFSLKHSQEIINGITSLNTEELTFDNTFAALESSGNLLNKGWGRLMHLDSVCDNEAQRQAINAVLPAVVTHNTSIALNPKLWEVLKQAAKSLENSELSPIKKRFIEETLLDFKESGADLSPEKKERIAQINNELSQLTKDFSEKVLDATNAWELIINDESELSGLPESAKSAARASAESKGLGTPEVPCWRFTQQYPSMAPVMQFADSDNLRKQVWIGANTVGSGKFDTAPLINSILTLRDEKAALLGFAHHADFTTSRRMAGSGLMALNFVEGLHNKVLAPFQEEMATLKAYKSAKTGQTIELLHPWEISYWSEKQRQELYDFNEEELRPYLSVPSVMEGLFSLVHTLFGITVKEVPTFYQEQGSSTPLPEDSTEVWHNEVQFYNVHDDTTGEHLGSFYADWHPRESKRGGAWMNSLVTGLPPHGQAARQPHLGLICGNMTKPIGDSPALLTHREAETIFHEFGHLLHHLLSNVEIKSLAGTNVAWDFVELPSQIMENWCWERAAIDQFARHYKTQELIPDALFEKMRAARNYQSATAFMRQLTFGKLDLELHIHLHKYIHRDIEEIDTEILHDYRVPMTEHGPSIARRLTHIFGDPVGYSAGYYSYKWAEVLDADAFTRFQKEGIMNPAIGRSFRECILSKGNSLPAAELYRAFMGRDPELTPLLVRSGIITHA